VIVRHTTFSTIEPAIGDAVAMAPTGAALAVMQDRERTAATAAAERMAFILRIRFQV
jgi:hypothetical protein